jgi:Rad3-related DNA helicase
LVVGTDASTKYTQRTEEMYQKYAQYIKSVTETKKGNYLVFFPSHLSLERVKEKYEELHSELKLICQEQVMKEQDREMFLNEFELEHENGLVGFCVLGGIFSEGIDLTAEKLIGAMIVGTGLPQVCGEREILKNYFDKQGENGFSYAYLYPGMNKVLQAAGRVIRTEEDRGIVLLLDERFLKNEYQTIFPREWSNVRISNLSNIQEITGEFWQNHE